VDTGSRADPPERENGKGKFLAYMGYKKTDPSPNENESLAPPSNTSPKEFKKLRRERDANFQRERKRSKTYATKSLLFETLSIKINVCTVSLDFRSEVLIQVDAFGFNSCRTYKNLRTKVQTYCANICFNRQCLKQENSIDVNTLGSQYVHSVL
jgi:hypothetical protein